MESALYRDIFQDGEQRGITRNQAETIVRILALRAGTIDPAVREKIYAQTILELLDVWYNEALLVTTPEQAAQLAEKIRSAPVPAAAVK